MAQYRVPQSPSAPLDPRTIRARHSRSPIVRPMIPMCLQCGSDDSLVFSEYTEPVILLNGHLKPARTRYCCARCGRSRDHAVAAGWRPPGWFWCT